MFAKKLLITFLVAMLAVAPALAQRGGFRGQRAAASVDYLTRGDVAEAARDYLLSHDSFAGAQGAMDFETISVVNDKMGQSHVRFQPYINGMPVYGAQVVVHSGTKSGEVLRIDRDTTVTGNLTTSPSTGSVRALHSAIGAFGVRKYTMESRPELAYVLDGNREPVLTWNAMITYEDAEGPQKDRIFADAQTGKLITRYPEFHYSRNRLTYDGNNTSSLPGTLRRNESSGNTGDSCLDAAHNYAGNTYDYYANTHGRDSYDGNGATMRSTVHHQNNYNNAFWNGTQMVYGDGDGSTFTCLAQSLDVVAHELTHAVTEKSAGLIYQNESGALNEAMSDIFGAAVEAMVDGSVNANTWKLGEDIYTPGTSGDALRYMNNPTQDGQSYDYYPERYTGSGDNGGVHINSGIANLAFYLLVEGGTHPRNKTTQSVSSIGITKAAAVFYRALTVYMTPSTNFAGARAATIQSATDLYGANSNEVTQFGNAWTAVGVGGSGGGGGTGTISNGQTITGLSASSGSDVLYKISVPAGATDLVISISGGSGDADLYTRAGAAPTDSTYDCRPYRGGNSESCTNASPAAGDHYIRVKAYSTFSSVSLTASYTEPSGGGSGPGGGTVDNISATTGNWARYTIDVPAGSSEVSFTISGGSGDADLYIRRGSQPTTSAYDHRPYLNGNNESVTINNPASGTYHIGIRAYSSFSGVKLVVAYE